ncbi:MAG: hypothetical protein E7504_08665 [Ruminococcus sp.]|nr:hypothetical protein [Ruminococcus sp.]
MSKHYIFDRSIKELGKEELAKATSNTTIDGKAEILAYLKRFPECAFTSEPVKDAFTGEVVYDANNARTDGVYQWYETEIYHFDKYNLKLNEEFIQYVLNRP